MNTRKRENAGCKYSKWQLGEMRTAPSRKKQRTESYIFLSFFSSTVPDKYRARAREQWFIANDVN